MKELFEGACAVCRQEITKERQEKLCKSSIITVARMLDEHRFVYGISGVFQITKPLQLKCEDKICESCIQSLEDWIVVDKSIKCDLCENLYQPCWDDSSSGWGCSVNPFIEKGKVKLSGGWGSDYDMTIFNVLSPVVRLGQKVCDSCVKQLLEEGSIEVDKSNQYEPSYKPLFEKV